MDESRLGFADGALMNLGLVCNLRCKHCYFDSDRHEWKPMWKILLNILLIRICRIGRIDITGGEPTLHPHIGLIVKYCDWLGFRRIRLDTNGTRDCGELAKNPKVEFSVSFHSHVREDLKTITGRDILGDLTAFFKNHRVTYVTTVLGPWNTDVENTLVSIRDIVGDVTMCLKFLDYNYCHAVVGFETLKLRKEIHEMIRRLFEKYPNARLDCLCYPFCFFDKDVMDRICVSPGVKKAHLEYQKASVSKLSNVFEWLLMIFGTVGMRNELELKIRDRENQRYWTRMPACLGCSESECPGIHKNYYRYFGDAEIHPI